MKCEDSFIQESHSEASSEWLRRKKWRNRRNISEKVRPRGVRRILEEAKGIEEKLKERKFQAKPGRVNLSCSAGSASAFNYSRREARRIKLLNSAFCLEIGYSLARCFLLDLPTRLPSTAFWTVSQSRKINLSGSGKFVGSRRKYFLETKSRFCGCKKVRVEWLAELLLVSQRIKLFPFSE